MRTELLFMGLFGILVGNVAKACSIGPAPPPTRIEPTAVVFAGVVEGYLDEGYALPMDLLKGKSTAAGVRVRVTEGVTRAKTGTVVDVFPSGHGTDCKSRPYNISMVRERYRIGTSLAVVAFSDPQTVEFPTVAHSFDIGNHEIAIVPTDYPRTANGTMDFAKVSKVSRASVESIEYRRRLYADRAFQYYETYKSLALLGSVIEESRKIMELSNIRYYYGYQCMMDSYARDAFVELVRNTGLSESVQARVLAETPRFSKGTVFEGYCES